MSVKSENMTTIPIKDFAKKKICDGHLYLKTKEGRRFYVLKPGILIDPAFVKKHASLNSVFEFIPLADEKITQNFKTLFHELKYLQFEKDLRMKSKEILEYFSQVYRQENHFISFVIAAHEEFCGLSPDTQLKMHETEINYFKKSIYASSFSILIGLANDFYHYPMLKDLYNVTLGLDVGICDANYSFFVAQACNQENINPGTGLAWLKSQNASAAEIEVFLKHPEKSHGSIKTYNILAFPELAEIVLYQHELSQGNGFPRGITKSLISSSEAVVILADSLVEIKDEYHFEFSVIDFLKSYTNKKLSELPVGKAYQKLMLALDYFEIHRGTGTDG